jgi:hypothetical protein
MTVAIAKPMIGYLSEANFLLLAAQHQQGC